MAVRLTPPQRKVLDFLALCGRASTGKIGDALYANRTGWMSFRQRRALAERVVRALRDKGIIEHVEDQGWVLTDAGRSA